MDRRRRHEPEKPILPGLYENQPQPPATAPVRLAGSCLAHRAQQTAKVGFQNVGVHPHHRPADLDLHALPRLGRTRLRRRLALDLLRPQSGSATPPEQLRRRDIQRPRQRRNLTPGSSDVAIARSLKSSDQRRRSPTGAPSSRSARTSMNWFVSGLRIGLDIDVAIHVQPLPNTRPAPPEWCPVTAY